MKLNFNAKEIYELSEISKKVIKNDILSEIFEEDMVRRCKYSLMRVVEKDSKLKSEVKRKELESKGISTVPVGFLRLAEFHAEEFPVEIGYFDINDIECKVGDISFNFPKQHQKICRKINENKNVGKVLSEYLQDERSEYEERMIWIIKHKYERCLERLKREWLPKLQEKGITEVPTNDDELSELIFSQPEYKNRSQREAENKPVI